MHEPFESDQWLRIRVPRLRVALRIRGRGLDPDFLTQLLGIAPTSVGDDGDEWTYRMPVPDDTELGSAVEALLTLFTDDTTVWEEVTGAYAADVQCELAAEAGQRTDIDASVLASLGRRGLPLSLEFVAADHDDEGDG